MEQIIGAVGSCSTVFVPILALWAIACLYTQHDEGRCCVTEGAYFLALLIIAGVTVRTIAVNDHCWLAHTASLSVVTLAGVLRKPIPDLESE